MSWFSLIYQLHRWDTVLWKLWKVDINISVSKSLCLQSFLALTSYKTLETVTPFKNHIVSSTEKMPYLVSLLREVYTVDIICICLKISVDVSLLKRNIVIIIRTSIFCNGDIYSHDVDKIKRRRNNNKKQDIRMIHSSRQLFFLNKVK